MSSSVQALRLQKVDPPPLLAEALTDDLFNRVRLTPVPVHVINAPNVGDTVRPFIGVCFEREYAEHGEITLCTELLTVISDRLKPRQIVDIQSVYLHECAHRLLPDHGHNGAFLALVMIMYLRAGNFMIQRVDIYDASEEPDFAECWSWAWSLAQNIYKSDSSIEKIADLIKLEYSAWQARERFDPAKHAAKAARAERIRRDRENEIRSYFFVAGITLASLIAYLF